MPIDARRPPCSTATAGPAGRNRGRGRSPRCGWWRRNLEVHARLWGLDTAGTKKRIAAVIEPFGLGEVIDRPVDSFSGGQRRRLEIARSLVSEPDVLFLDEPTVGLDPRFRAELLAASRWRSCSSRRPSAAPTTT